MTKHFTIDARAMLTWGRESIKDHTTAVLELVKNGYDAHATIVEVEIKTSLFAAGGPYIRVADNGTGMSEEDVARHWLRLGYSAKRDERFTSRGRRKTGEKGIGRISADRLGALLELRSQSRKKAAVGLRVNWQAFEVSGRDLAEIPIDEIAPVRFSIPAPSKWNASSKQYSAAPGSRQNGPGRPGTELIIRELRQSWEPEDIQELHRQLSLLRPPFEVVEDFQIRLESDVDTNCNGVVASPLMASAAIDATFILHLNGNVEGTISHRIASSRRRVQQTFSLPVDQMIHPRQRPGGEGTRRKMVQTLGPVRARLLFYPQKAETVRGLDFNLADLREFLQTNAGVRVYRDSVRVPPYGDQGRPEGDWLALGDRKARNPAGPTRPDFRVSPYQLVGAVFIGRDSNPHLVDTSGREGLVAGEALALLKSFLIGCLTRLETHYHKLFVKAAVPAEEQVHSPRDTVDELRIQISELAASIRKAEHQLPAVVTPQISRVAQKLAATSETLKRAEKTVEDLSSQAAISRTLATIGIAAATFGHETHRGLDSMAASLHAANFLLTRGEPAESVMEELEKAVAAASQVSAWGGFALGRVRRDKRTRRLRDVAAIVANVVEELRPALEASSITLNCKAELLKARVFTIDVECVVINLLTNAYYFAKQSQRERRVSVTLRPKKWRGRSGFQICVGDSGPGVAEEARERIWDPLYTTKTDERGTPVGTGLGLALVQAVVQDVEGARFVDNDPNLHGARFAVWLPDGGA